MSLPEATRVVNQSAADGDASDDPLTMTDAERAQFRADRAAEVKAAIKRRLSKITPATSEAGVRQGLDKTRTSRVRRKLAESKDKAGSPRSDGPAPSAESPEMGNDSQPTAEVSLASGVLLALAEELVPMTPVASAGAHRARAELARMVREVTAKVQANHPNVQVSGRLYAIDKVRRVSSEVRFALVAHLLTRVGAEGTQAAAVATLKEGYEGKALPKWAAKLTKHELENVKTRLGQPDALPIDQHSIKPGLTFSALHKLAKQALHTKTAGATRFKAEVVITDTVLMIAGVSFPIVRTKDRYARRRATVSVERIQAAAPRARKAPVGND